MKQILFLTIDLFRTLCILLKPGGLKSIIAEYYLMKQQLCAIRRKRKRAPNLSSFDRIVFGLCSLLISPHRLSRNAIVISQSTLLKFHKAMVKRKYRRLFSPKKKAKPGPKGPSPELIDLVLQIKTKNPSYGCEYIAYLVSDLLKETVSHQTVRRILRKHLFKPGGGPSWLNKIGNQTNKLWSVDMFRVESMLLKSHWIMVVMDQYTRKIIGFAVHAGCLDGIAVCVMFNEISRGKKLPKYLSSDNDPLFTYHQWIANLSIIGIREIKTVSECPWSHTFIERLIKSVRNELTDKIFFWSEHALKKKLFCYREYFNHHRVHFAHDGRTPGNIAVESEIKRIDIKNYRWKSVCDGMYQIPIAA